jgi:hypothetical protein
MRGRKLLNNKIRKGRFVFAIALVAALLAAYVPAPAAYAVAAPPYSEYTYALPAGKAKVSNIGRGLKAKPVKALFCYNPKGDKKHIFDTYITFDLKITGKAKTTGIYVLAVYYKGRKIGATTSYDSGSTPYGNIDFGVVKGKVKSSVTNVIARLSACKKKIDLSKLKVKCVKFIPGYSVDLRGAKAAGNSNGMHVWIYGMKADGETRKNIKLANPLNVKSDYSSPVYIVKKNTQVRFFAEGLADDENVRKSGTMTVTVDADGKTASGDVIVHKGDEGSTREDFPSFFSDKYDNWGTGPVKVENDVKVIVKSVTFTPFASGVTGTPQTLSAGNGVYAKITDADYMETKKSSGKYFKYFRQGFFRIVLDLSGTAIKHPLLQTIKLNYAGDASNLNFSVNDNELSDWEKRFVIADKYTFTGKNEDEQLYFWLGVKDPGRPVTLDLSKFTISGILDENIVKVKSAKKIPEYGVYNIYETKRQGITMILRERDSDKYNSPVFSIFDDFATDTFSGDTRLYNCARKGGTMKLEVVAYGEVEKSGTISYTVMVNGKAYKTGKLKVKKGDEFSRLLRTVNLKLDSDVRLKLTTKFVAAK